MKHKGFVLWFTGLSGSGKSTLANEIYKKLKVNGTKIEKLDGDVVRENLTKDLGFSPEDRDENIRRIGFVSNLLSKNGVAVLASFISPYIHQRKDLRAKVENYIEVFVNASLEVCEARDVKGLYKKARTGEIPLFTGITDPYEAPDNSDIELRTDELSVDECVNQIINYLKKKGFIFFD
ncbi:adenylyl-sulfate kinase [bacterium]|nr:adenylyl-sulfate kinase [bacterium]